MIVERVLQARAQSATPCLPACKEEGRRLQYPE